MLKGQKIVIGVSGGIAAYKIPDLVRILRGNGAEVHVMMTEAAQQFVAPLVLEVLSGNRVCVDMWDGDLRMNHIELAKTADLVLIVPATANLIGKYAHGIADNLVLTTLLASKAPVVLAPAMNTNMWEHPAVQDNLVLLKKRGVNVIDPDVGELACGAVGVGRFPDADAILQYVYVALGDKRVLEGKKIVITAGATREYADPVRFLSNGASGKMGKYFALAAKALGAEVLLVKGPGSVKVIADIRQIDVVSAEEMYQAVKANFDDCNLLVSTAAVADFRFGEQLDTKLKKDGGDPKLVRTVDVLKAMSELKRPDQVFVGFGLESEFDQHRIEVKMQSKKMDWMIYDSPAAIGSEMFDCKVVSAAGTKDYQGISKIKLAEEILRLF